MQLKWSKLTHKVKVNHFILILVAFPKAHQSITVIVKFKSNQSEQNPTLFIGKVASKYTEIIRQHFCAHERYMWCIPMEICYPMQF